MDNLFVIKIGGNVIDSPELLSDFLFRFAKIKGKKILVHGGGKLATRLAEKLDIPQQLIEGRRITDEETLRIVTMVYAGQINKTIVAGLQAHHCNAMGVSGADGNLILSHKRKASVDYGYVGDIDAINTSQLRNLLNHHDAVVVAPITHNGEGQLLNTNADTIAQELARASSSFVNTTLIYCFEKKGVLNDMNDENSVIRQITPTSYLQLKQEQKNDKPVISEGMIPKIENALKAVKQGVARVIIGQAQEIELLISGKAGTVLQND
jgi:acetylglutamate kinase